MKDNFSAAPIGDFLDDVLKPRTDVVFDAHSHGIDAAHWRNGSVLNARDVPASETQIVSAIEIVRGYRIGDVAAKGIRQPIRSAHREARGVFAGQATAPGSGEN